MIILEDTRQQANKHDLKHKWFTENGIRVNRCTLVCGDYQIPGDGSVAIDSKSGLAEVIGDIQFKAITKKAVMEAVSDIYVNYHLSTGEPTVIYHMITDDDANRFPETEITDYCFMHHIPDERMKDFLDLYTKRHGFFHRGLIRAKEYNVKLYILVEEDGIKSIEDVFRWVNPRLQIFTRSGEIYGYYSNGRPKRKSVQKYPNAMRGQQLAKSMITMQNRYGCEFVFCSPKESGRMIVKLLTKES